MPPSHRCSEPAALGHEAASPLDSGFACRQDKPPKLTMPTYTEIRIRGKTIRVPSLTINGQTLVITGKALKTVAVHDEDFIATNHVAGNPEAFVDSIKASGIRADLFTFAQHLTDPSPRYEYSMEWDDAAVIPITTFADWWAGRSTDLRRDVKRAAKLGVAIRTVDFDDEFVRGVVSIYAEAPVRQGRRFWHYGKDVAQVKTELSTYLEVSDFLGAYVNDELIGFLKIVHVGTLGRLMFILSKIAHRDKRPTNALIAAAVQLCEARKHTHLTYGTFASRPASGSLIAFKHRNGFEQLRFPRYFVPLNAWGLLCLKLRCHHGLRKAIPTPVQNAARAMRATAYSHVSSLRTRLTAGSRALPNTRANVRDASKL
jgi:hypothetical protein